MIAEETVVRHSTRFVSILAGVTLTCLVAAAPRAEGPLQVVERQVKAFNRHDVDGMLKLVAPDVRWFGVSRDGCSTELEGREALRKWLEGYFESLPSVSSRIEQSLVAGDLVSVRERATWKGADGESSQAALAVYEVRDGVIRSVWYHAATP